MPNQKLNLTNHLLTHLPYPAANAETPANLPLRHHPAWRRFLDLIHDRLIVPNPALKETFLALLHVADTM